MGNNTEAVKQAIKNLAWALPLLFIGPSVIYNAFINKNNLWHYAVLALGIGICLLGVYLAFKGIQNIVNSMFDNDKE